MPCNRCGQCCTKLYLNFSPETLLSTANESMKLPITKQSVIDRDVIFLVDALLLTQFIPAHEQAGKNLPDYWEYRCRHLIPQSASMKAACSAYDRRPHTCRDFPYYRRQSITAILAEGCGYHQEALIMDMESRALADQPVQPPHPFRRFIINHQSRPYRYLV